MVLAIDGNTYFLSYILVDIRQKNLRKTMGTKFKKGDRVKWKVGKGETTGEIIKKVTESTTIDGKEITATKSKPRYLVKNDKTGNIKAYEAKSLSLIEIEDNQNLKPKQQKILENFQSAVNMDASEIKQWLKTKESNSVGQKDKNGKIKGRKSGKKIVKIL
ncbi:MAG: HVA1 family protein, partial [Waterburya sp.]